MTESSDVVIVGGGVVGSSVAWHLRQDGFTGRILIVEDDPNYTRASSFLAMGGIRQQFCTPVTVQMVQFSVRLWTEFDRVLGTPASRPRAWFRQRGYLFLANRESADTLEHRYEEEKRAGAIVKKLSVDEIRAMCPDVMLDDIAFGVFGPDDGYANPREVLSGFRSAAAAAGAKYLNDEVVASATPAVASKMSRSRADDFNTGGRQCGGTWRATRHPRRYSGVASPMRQMLFRCELLATLAAPVSDAHRP